MNTYIQDKLDELLPIQIDILYNEDGQEIVKRQAIVNLFTDHHNHIVEKMRKELEYNLTNGNHGWENYNHALKYFINLLQDTNPKE